MFIAAVIALAVAVVATATYLIATNWDTITGAFGNISWESSSDSTTKSDNFLHIDNSGKSDPPSWVQGEGYKVNPNESPSQNATRIMNEKYGKGNWSKKPGGDHNWIKKWIEWLRGGRGRGGRGGPGFA